MVNKITFGKGLSALQYVCLFQQNREFYIMTKKIPIARQFLIFPSHVLKKHDEKGVVTSQESPSFVDNQTHFTHAYEAYHVLLFKYCYLRVSDSEKAIDIVQETYVRVWQYLKQGNSIGNDKSFLFIIAHHLIIDEYRRKKNISLEMIMNTKEEPETIPKENLYLQEDITRVMNIVNTLPLPYRTVLRMRYVDDMSVKEISHILKKTNTTISVRIHRGIKKIQKLLVLH